jgi:hypothetical protein
MVGMVLLNVNEKTKSRQHDMQENALAQQLLRWFVKNSEAYDFNPKAPLLANQNLFAVHGVHAAGKAA